MREAILQSAHPCIPSESLDCSRYLRGRLNVGGAYDLVTKKQQAVTDSTNSVQQIQESVNVRLVESSKRLPVLGVQNAEFTTLNPEIATPSTLSSTLDAMKALENPDSIEPKSIDIEKNKQTKNQIQENNMTEIIEETCGCPKRKKMEDKINEQTNDITMHQIRASDVQATESTITNHEVATSSVMPSQILSAECSANGKQSLVYALGTPGYDFGSEARRDSFIQRLKNDTPKKYEHENC